MCDRNALVADQATERERERSAIKRRDDDEGGGNTTHLPLKTRDSVLILLRVPSVQFVLARRAWVTSERGRE